MAPCACNTVVLDCLIYSLSNWVGFTVREVSESARRVTGHSIPAVEGSGCPGDPAVLIANSDKIGRELGWQTEYTDLDSILASVWEWHEQRCKKNIRIASAASLTLVLASRTHCGTQDAALHSPSLRHQQKHQKVEISTFWWARSLARRD